MTPSPDKLEIPEAAVEAAARAIYEWRETAGDQIPMGTLWRELPEESRESYREDGLAAIHGFIPHMPDHGYAEVGVRLLLWSGNENNQFAHTELGLFFSLKPDVGSVWHLIRHEGSAETHSIWKTIGEAKAFAQTKWEELVRSALIAPPAPADNGKPATHDEDSILDVISGNLRMESWVAGKTLTVMFDMESGERRFAKLRLTKISAQPSPADLKGEPE